MATPPFDVKNLEESIQKGLVVTGGAVGSFLLLKTVKIASPLKLDASNIIKLSGGIITGTLIKDYAVYKKWM